VCVLDKLYFQTLSAHTASSSAIQKADIATKDNFTCLLANFMTYTIYVSQNTSMLYVF
jgi:hypothetical protein